MSFMSEAFSPVSHNIQAKSRRTGISIENAQWLNSSHEAFLNKRNSIAQKTGIRYERRVEQKLAILANDLGFELIAHKWIGYNSRCFAQPDFVIVSPNMSAIVIEAKYTYTDTSDQRELYTRLLQNLGFKHITSITVCHNLTSGTPRDKIIHDFHDLKQDSIWQLRI